MLRNPVGLAVLVTAARLAWPGAVEAQRAPSLTLRAADATLAEEFSEIVSVRELGTGRVLISDRRENRIVLADLETGSVEPVSRPGSGPLEYRSAHFLYPLAGDSTLLSDAGNGRWILLDAGRPVATIPAHEPVVEIARVPLGTDAQGHVLGRTIGAGVGGLPLGAAAGAGRDSFGLVLVRRDGGRADTIARLRAPFIAAGERSRNPDTRITLQRLTFPAWSAGEQAILFLDGWIAIARLDPYRVEWRTPAGEVVQGPPLPFRPVRVDERERRAWLERSSSPTRRATAPDEWPEVFPPFSSVSRMLDAPSPALLAASDGRLLIRRFPTASMPGTHYDVVDRTGKLVGELALPRNEAIIGFGRRSVYVVVTDDDGLQRLRRHPWP